MMDPTKIVDLARYPIAEPTSGEAARLVTGCRAQLSETGLCLLPGFVRPAALASMIGEAQRLTPEAHHTEHWRASQRAGGETSGTIPRETRASIAAVAYDRIADDSPLRAFYEWDALTRFVAAVLDDGPLYRSSDPLVACMLTMCRTGDELGWHYDPNDGVVSLMLQESEAGGAFEFAPGMRDAGSAPGETELAVLDGRYERLVRPTMAPGTLSLFNGRQALHRVAPVTGARPRIMALFSYTAEAGHVFSDDIHQRFFGRAA